jgi:hypothetical protein
MRGWRSLIHGWRYCCCRHAPAPPPALRPPCSWWPRLLLPWAPPWLLPPPYPPPPTLPLAVPWPAGAVMSHYDGYIGRLMALAKRTSSVILWIRLVGHLNRSPCQNCGLTRTVLKNEHPSIRIAQVMHRHTSAVNDSRMMCTSCWSRVSATSSKPL